MLRSQKTIERVLIIADFPVPVLPKIITPYRKARVSFNWMILLI
jgi:hypothetical protein